MKRTSVLFQQHSGRMFRDIWRVQKKRVLLYDGALKELKENSIPFEDANEVIREIGQLSKVKICDHYPPKVAALDENHPSYQEEPCLKYSDHNVMIGGLDQAKVFTNTVEMDLNTLPMMDVLNSSVSDTMQDRLIKNCIKSSLLFDATQEKLPKRKDPERPAFVFPRDYGIPEKRKVSLLGGRLIQLCSALSPHLLNHHRIVSGPVHFQSTIFRNGKRIILSNTADNLITVSEGIERIVDHEVTLDLPLPSIHPLSPIVSLETHNFYKFDDLYPLSKNVDKNRIHTVFFHFIEEEVSNLFETKVTDSQVLSRSLMKGYNFALSQARQRFGKEVTDLPEPVVIQCVHMNGKTFHFSVLQLNTTGGPDDTNVRNSYWSLPTLQLYDYCDYIDGRPELGGYDPLVFLTILTFFRNI